MRFILLIFILISSQGFGQIKNYKNLVFEGAGIRGLAYAGVVEELERAGILKNIEKVGGTSAGGLIALAISLGYNSKEIKEIITNTDFNKFNDRGNVFGRWKRLNHHYGWYRGNKFDSWLSHLIAAKTGNGDATFMDLHRAGYKDLYIVATCLNLQKQLVFSYENYPAMKVKDAVRISSSIPLYFEAVFIDSTGAVVKNPGKRNDLNVVVDGGITGNYPITLFDTIVNDSIHNKIRKPNTQTLGIRIDSDQQIENDSASHQLHSLPITSMKTYIEAFYIYVIENLNRNALTEADWERTISISSKDIGPKVKKLSLIQQESLISSGKQGVIRFLKQNK